MSVRREQGGCILDVGRSYGPHVSQVVESIYVCMSVHSKVHSNAGCIFRPNFYRFYFFTLIYMYKKIDTLKNKVYDKNMYTSKLLRSVFFLILLLNRSSDVENYTVIHTARRKVNIKVAFCLKLQTKKFCTNRVPFCKIKTIRKYKNNFLWFNLGNWRFCVNHIYITLKSRIA